jgi:hypothetical protein
MRLTLIIASTIFMALFAYARLLAVVQEAERTTGYDNAAPHPLVQTAVVASQSN